MMKFNLFLIGIIFLSGCSKKIANVNHGNYVYDNGYDYTELNLMNNNTFCRYHIIYDIATPQVNVGIYLERNDSLYLEKNKSEFLNRNLKIEYGENSKTIKIDTYILMDLLTLDEIFTTFTSLKVYGIKNNQEFILKELKFIYPFPMKTSELIDKKDLVGVEKLLIKDERIGHTYEVEEDVNKLSLIQVPIGFLNSRSYDKYDEIESYKVKKSKNSIRLLRNEHYIEYKLHKN